MGYIEEVNEALAAFPPFWQRVGEYRFTENALDTLQINIGLKCNLACRHCHVESSPARTEEMSRETLEQCLTVFRDRGFKPIDVTGGAPEMNPNYEWFLRGAVGAGASVMTRSNLSICKESGYEHIPDLWAELGITVIASLPHYVKKTSEKQRGAGTFARLDTARAKAPDPTAKSSSSTWCSTRSVRFSRPSRKRSRRSTRRS